MSTFYGGMFGYGEAVAYITGRWAQLNQQTKETISLRLSEASAAILGVTAIEQIVSSSGSKVFATVCGAAAIYEGYRTGGQELERLEEREHNRILEQLDFEGENNG